MFKTLPSLNGLRAFESVARLGSFSAAAEELHVTHGAVSRLIKVLEGQLDTTLLTRGRQGARATSSGTRLYERLRPALELMRLGVDEMGPQPSRGPLVLSCYGTFLMRWLMPRFHRFRERNPDIEISFTTHNNLANFADRRIDMAISTALPEKTDDLVTLTLFEEFCGPVCSAQMIKGRGNAALEQLARLTLLHTETRPSAWRDWAELAGASGFDTSSGENFEHFYFMLQAAASGLGVAIGPHALVADDLATGQLAAPFSFIASGREYTLSYRQVAAQDIRIRAFSEWLLEEAKNFEKTVCLESA